MLVSTPTALHLARMYHELAQHGARAVGKKGPWPYRARDPETLFCLAADMSRYDPRLFDIVVEFLYFHWRRLNPLKLRENLPAMRTPQALAVISGFVAHGLADPEFRHVHEYLSRALSPAAGELFFMNLYPPGGSLIRRAAEEPLEEFAAWGFLARARPIIHGPQRLILGHWGPRARQNIIHRLATQKDLMSLSEYLAAVEHTISRQQALADLKASPHLTMTGRGRGCVWVKR